MTKISICEICKTTFTQKPGTTGRYCSVTCSAEAKSNLLKEKYKKKYLENPKHCKHCNKELEYDHKKNTFCSKSCAASYNNTGRIRNDESKKKISNILKKLHNEHKLRKIPQVGKNNPNYKHGKYSNNKLCVVCGNKSGTRKTCSTECYKIFLSQQQTQWLKQPQNRKIYKGNRGQSYMEKTFEDWLKSVGFTKGKRGYLTELHFYNKTSKKHGWADFAFPTLKVIIELDGTQHLKQVKQDKIRDTYLRSKGYNVIRISIKDFSKDKWVENIKTLLNVN